jgi:hypothetical protein
VNIDAGDGSINNLNNLVLPNQNLCAGTVPIITESTIPRQQGPEKLSRENAARKRSLPPVGQGIGAHSRKGIHLLGY